MNKEKTTVKDLETITQVAKENGISPDQARYWVKLLELDTHKIGRNRYLSAECADVIRQAANVVAEGKAPQEAAVILKELATVTVTEKAQPLAKQTEEFDSRLSGIERGMMLLVEEVKKLRQENQILRTQLLPPEEPARKVLPWKPESPVPDPLANKSLLQRFWIELTKPEKMRRHPN